MTSSSTFAEYVEAAPEVTFCLPPMPPMPPCFDAEQVVGFRRRFRGDWSANPFNLLDRAVVSQRVEPPLGLARLPTPRPAAAVPLVMDAAFAAAGIGTDPRIPLSDRGAGRRVGCDVFDAAPK